MSRHPAKEKTSPIREIFPAACGVSLHRPLFLSGVSAGFPSPADDYLDRKLDLNEHLIKNPAATFFVRVAGDSMTGAGINDNDILVVDRSLEPCSGSIVIAVINGELTVKRLLKGKDSCRLIAENPDYADLEIDEETPLEIWGVATYAIHSL
jgi:DNA polymerase V